MNSKVLMAVAFSFDTPQGPGQCAWIQLSTGRRGGMEGGAKGPAGPPRPLLAFAGHNCASGSLEFAELRSACPPPIGLASSPLARGGGAAETNTVQGAAHSALVAVARSFAGHLSL